MKDQRQKLFECNYAKRKQVTSSQRLIVDYDLFKSYMLKFHHKSSWTIWMETNDCTVFLEASKDIANCAFAYAQGRKDLFDSLREYANKKSEPISNEALAT